MTSSELSRRRLLKYGGSAIAGASVLRITGPTAAFQGDAAAEVIPWSDPPEANPVPEAIVRQLDWEQLDSWLTPIDEHFAIKHFSEPALTEADWKLEVNGLVETPLSLTLADIKSRERQEVTFAMECSGNSGFPFFIGGVSNATWGGTALAPLLEEAGVLDEGIEVVFWGADAGEQTWRDEITFTEHFARSMSVSDAMSEGKLLVYEMNGEPLPSLHGFPLRLIAPGWYGVANVKWLTRIEVMDRRYQGFFMARDYVTIRELEEGGESTWTLTSVTHARIKSAPAKVLKSGEQYSIMGAAWGAPIATVEVRIDDGEWLPATIVEGEGSEYAWVFWTLDWDAPTAGEHEITSRATDAEGNVQPAPDDPFLAGKKTYWESNGHITRHITIE